MSRQSIVRVALRRTKGALRRLRFKQIRKALTGSVLWDAAYYLQANSDVAQAGVEALDHYLSKSGAHRNPHPLFDANWYFDLNPELRANGQNPLLHYLQTGWKADKWPCPLFDGAFYLANDPQAAYLDQDPLSRYLLFGGAGLYDPHPLFDTRYYLSQNPSLDPAQVNPLVHYLTRGWRAGKNPHPLFDVSFYVNLYPDVKASGAEPLRHYLLFGGAEGRDPHPLFDSDWYFAQSPNAISEQPNPLVHYVTTGWKQKLNPCAAFDEAFYQENNPDIAKVGISSLHHFLLRGAGEGRNPNRWFDTRWYASENPEILAAGWNPLAHYVQVGGGQGRRTRQPSQQPRAPAIRKHARRRIVFISGEPDTPGHQYRVVNIALSLARRFFETVVIDAQDVAPRFDDIASADLIWIWRARLLPELAMVLPALRDGGAPLLYDVDDLMFRPELATADVIDGIRTQDMQEADVRKFYTDIRLLLTSSDRCTVPTVTLADEVREIQKPASVIPNGFSRETFERAIAAMRSQASASRDGLLRVGYAGATPTHQKDLAVASRALAGVLTHHPDVRLVLFRQAIILEEFPELRRVQEQIEWRDLVSFEDLPLEYARFDVNIAPLETGNPYCEAKSEGKFFEAALVGVPTIASPTRPFAEVIKHGENGLLADGSDDWYYHLKRLLSDRDLRRRLAARARRDALWLYGPERRSLLVTRLVNQMLAPEPSRVDLFRAEIQPSGIATIPSIDVPDYDVLLQSGEPGHSRVSVIVPLYNYEHYVEEALDSVLQQTVRNIDLIIVDDHSTDDSAAVASEWLIAHASRFNLVALLQNRRNSKLARTRNAGIDFAQTELYMPLDADNALLPDCLESCMRELDESGAAFAYPTISLFGDQHGQIGLIEYDPAQFQCINYIDAMAMVRKACWIAVGGYTPLDPGGWEDYEFWCKLVEKGMFGIRVPETTARYRIHGKSMLRTETDIPESKRLAIEEMNRRHPWLELRVPQRATVSTAK